MPKGKRSTPLDLKLRFAKMRDKAAKAKYPIPDGKKATCKHTAPIYLWDADLRCRACYNADKRIRVARKLLRKRLQASPNLYHYRKGILVQIGTKGPYDVPTRTSARTSERWAEARARGDDTLT